MCRSVRPSVEGLDHLCQRDRVSINSVSSHTSTEWMKLSLLGDYHNFEWYQVEGCKHQCKQSCFWRSCEGNQVPLRAWNLTTWLIILFWAPFYQSSSQRVLCDGTSNRWCTQHSNSTGSEIIQFLINKKTHDE